MAALLACFALGACGEESDNTSSNDTQTATSYHSGSEYAKSNFKKVAVKVKKDSAKDMTKVMKDITAGKYDNKVVEMEGINTRYGNCAGILQDNGDGTKVGAMYYIINGIFPKDYPDKDAKIRLKGLVVEENGVRHLEVPKDQLEVLE